MPTREQHLARYSLWNPYTVMDEFLPYLGFGTTIIARGEGPYVFNARGKRYIDGLSSLWNVAVGHGRGELVEAAANQMRELAFASSFSGQTHPRAMELAAKLVEITSDQLQHAYLGTNGSEAVETAIKMVRQYHRQSPDGGDQGRYKILSLKGSYHGVSYGAMSAAGSGAWEAKYGPLVPGFLQIEPPYCYRCPYGHEHPDCGLECAKTLETTILSEGPETVAAFIMEPIMAESGMVVPPEEYHARVGEICRRHGVLFIADEVSTGFGRTGKLFATQDWEPGPDILCLGKAISSGYLPLAATLATDEIYRRFEGRENHFRHGSTASGHPVCSAVGLANIDIIIKERLPENAADLGAYIKSRLRNLQETHNAIGDLRGRGLMIGLELVKNRETKEPLGQDLFHMALDTANLGLATYYDLEKSFMALLPPLTIDKDIADEMVEILDKSLDTRTRSSIARKARLVREYAAFKLGRQRTR